MVIVKAPDQVLLYTKLFSNHRHLPRTYPEQFGWHTVKNMPKFKTRGEGCPKLANQEALDGPQAFAEMSWDHDLDWSDARLLPVIVYLKGGTALKLPEKWKAVFPRHLDL